MKTKNLSLFSLFFTYCIIFTMFVPYLGFGFIVAVFYPYIRTRYFIIINMFYAMLVIYSGIGGIVALQHFPIEKILTLFVSLTDWVWGFIGFDIINLGVNTTLPIWVYLKTLIYFVLLVAIVIDAFIPAVVWVTLFKIMKIYDKMPRVD